MTTPRTSLREVFDERTVSMPERPARGAEVASRVTRLRRQRAAATVAAVVVAVGLAVGLPLGFSGLGRTDRAVPAWEQTTDGLKVWAVGSKLVAHGSFRSDERRSATLTFRRTAGALTFSSVCSPDLGKQVEIYWSVNGHVMGGGSCAEGGGSYYTAGSFPDFESSWKGTGVAVGERATLRYWLTSGPRTASARASSDKGMGSPPTYRAAMPDTAVTFGIYQRVDPAAYPLPPRPKKLAVLTGPMSAGDGKILGTVDSRTVTGGPNAAVTLTRTLPVTGLDYQLGFVSPGQVLVSVNGTAIGRHESWGYGEWGAGGTHISRSDLAAAGLDVRPGDKVTITLTPSRFTDPGWTFYLLAGSPDAP